jgi:hypothetical protein
MSRRKGTGFELEIAELFKFTRTVNSGARDGDGDLRHPGGKFIVECKDDQRAESVSIPGKDLLKMRQQADTFGKGNWVRFTRNAKGMTVVSMNRALFETLLTIADGVIVCPDCKCKMKPDW